ncbi:MAG: hypothetical protein JXJ04_08685 [Spirochaetales bacterium]|nr:hypothetical protein [Spirochaetales bacterium]
MIDLRKYSYFFFILIFFLAGQGCINVPRENPREDEKPAESLLWDEIVNNTDKGEAQKHGPILMSDDDKDDNTDDESPLNTPAPLSINEALKQIRKFITSPERPVINNNSILYLIHDFTSDGIEEICVPGIKSENKENARIEFLSDYSRLFTEKKEFFTFFLYIFSINEGTLRLMNKIKLGEQSVYKSMTKFSLYKGKSDPVVLSFHFNTQEGSIQHWLVFKSPAVKPLSQLLLSDTFSCKALVEDIDNDGWIDINLFERVMEEGIGCETFITWKKWNKKEFIDFKTTNIVRNLNNFLFKVKESGLSGDVTKLISYSFDPGEVQKYTKMGLSEMEILYAFFGLTKYFGSGHGERFNIFEDIHEIIFPEILDNPFYIRDEKGFYVKLSFRIMYSDGVSLIPEVLIYMLKNPFGKQQFVLFPVTVNDNLQRAE